MTLLSYTPDQRVPGLLPTLLIWQLREGLLAEATKISRCDTPLATRQAGEAKEVGELLRVVEQHGWQPTIATIAHDALDGDALGRHGGARVGIHRVARVRFGDYLTVVKLGLGLRLGLRFGLGFRLGSEDLVSCGLGLSQSMDLGLCTCTYICLYSLSLSLSCSLSPHLHLRLSRRLCPKHFRRLLLTSAAAASPGKQLTAGLEPPSDVPR
mmetsp:Transcript_74697/g.148470  ORF Transcript_74697/g.148470 Transcript_74697/m.148470 type:complete len:211 (+) Transcript_74697:1-633(+)